MSKDKKKGKRGYYTFDPVIYPRKLFVMIGADGEDISKCFEGIGGVELDDIDFDVSSGGVYPNVMCKATERYGMLVVFPSKAGMTFSNVVHESFHVLDAFMTVLPLRREDGGSNEHLAYLLGWIGECINEARLGKGKFIEIEDIKEEE